MNRLTPLVLIICAMAALPAQAFAQDATVAKGVPVIVFPPLGENVTSGELQMGWTGIQRNDWFVPKSGEDTVASFGQQTLPPVADQWDLGGFCVTLKGTCQTVPGPNQSICFCGSDGGNIVQ